MRIYKTMREKRAHSQTAKNITEVILKIIYSPDHRIKMHLIRGLIFNREESDAKDILKKRLRKGNFRFVVRTILAHPGPHIERYPVFVFTKEIRLHLGKNSIHFKRQPFAVVRRLLVESTCADIISRHSWCLRVCF